MSYEAPDKAPVADTGHRQRTLTERGREYQKTLKLDRYGSAVSKLHRHMTSAKSLLGNKGDLQSLKQIEYRVLAQIEELEETFKELFPLLEKVELEEKTNCYERTQQNAHEVLQLLHTSTQRMEQDQRSSRSGTSSRRSRASSKQAEAAAEAAAAETELKYIQVEAEKRAELDKLQAQRKLEVARTKLETLRNFEDRDNDLKVDLPLPREDTTTKVKEYVRTLPVPGQSQMVDPVDRFQNLNLSPDAPPFVPLNQSAGVSQVVMSLNRPQVEISKFDGNPLNFRRFMRQFEMRIIQNTSSDEERLTYLEQLTQGDVNRIVKSYCQLPSATHAYQSVMSELEERYGDHNVIASAYVKKVLDWPSIKADNCRELDHFVVFLSECFHAVQSLEALSILEYPDNLRRIVSKLPFHLHDRWRSVVHRCQEEGVRADLSRLIDFVKVEAKKATHPVYGKEAVTRDIGATLQKTSHRPSDGHRRNRGSNLGVSNTKKKESVDGKSSFGASSSCDGQEQLCLLCKRGHRLEECDDLKRKTWREKIKALMERGICFGCLSHGHMKSRCRSKMTCSVCQGKHPTILHCDDLKAKSVALPNQHKGKEGAEGSGAVRHSKFESHMGNTSDDCTFAIVPVRVRMQGQLREIETYAFLDPGSNVTFCTEELLSQIGGHGSKHLKMTMDTMGVPHQLTTQLVQGLEICALSGGNSVSIPEAYTKTSIPATARHIPTNEDIAKWSHLRDVDLPQVEAPVGILIGNNVPDAYSPIELRTGPSNSPFATRTRLGWVVWSLVRDGSAQVNTLIVNRAELQSIVEIDEARRLEQVYRKSIDIDFPEKRVADRKEPSIEDKLFLTKVTNTLRFEDGHYQMALPFRDDKVQLPNNLSHAEHRLTGLKKKMMRNEQFHTDYVDFMEKMIRKEYAEEVPPSEITRSDGRVWYIPHHGVYHPRKPDKIRVVFDAAATFLGVSLNQLLLQGPDLTNDLLEVLMNFREEDIAVMADIEAMFYQVKVAPMDRDCLRFLWWPGGDMHVQPVVYRMRVHLFGAVSSPSCANVALHQAVKDNKHVFSAEVCEAVLQDFYVDDFLKSMPEVKSTIRLAEDVVDLCSRGGFRLTKWTSNDREFISSVAQEERAAQLREIDLEESALPPERALGVSWCVEADVFSFRIQVPDSIPLTRRGILSVVSSLFDPVGFVSPFVLRAKSLLQALCRLGLSWDEEIPSDCLDVWRSWLDELRLLESFRISRCIKPAGFGDIKSVQLHHFSDASEVGYGMVTYLRLLNTEGRVHCAMVMSRARVNPLKKVTIPRLELTAATVAVRLHAKVVGRLRYACKEVYFWTDSMSVLRFIWNRTSRFHTFVANRVSEIQECTTLDQWRYVPTKENPADMVSRGLSAHQLLTSSVWTGGPKFLWEEESEWPKLPDIGIVVENDPEVKRPRVNLAIAPEENNVMDRLLSHFSDWHKLKKTVAWLLIARKRLLSWSSMRKTLERQSEEERKQVEQLMLKEKSLSKQQGFPVIDVTLMDEAEASILKFQQRRSFPAEMGGTIGKSSPLYKLCPVKQNGLLRVGGRLERAEMSYAAKHPIILPRCHISTLILRDIHRKLGHLGRDAILAELRQKYWIVGASGAAKQLVKQCVICRRYQARAMGQMMADLPADRLVPGEPPFSRTGVDYFGPFEVKRGRSIVKRYGVIFTCLAIRAVHIEVAHSLDTSSCIHALRRFISRRGPVKIIWSDNGTNLVGAEKELKEEMQKWDKKHIHDHLLQKGIDWNFNPPSGSHFGGVWERMIRTVRKVLYSLLQNCPRNLDDEGLMTLFCEVEAVINDRPISRVSNDSNDAEALTPSQLLLLKSGPQLPCGPLVKEDIYSRKRWKQVQYMADLFWSRWSKEYVVLLQKHQKWINPKKNVAVGDVVLIVDSSPRCSWALGRVVDVEQDKHGLVRIAHVKTQTNTLRCPIHKLCMILECESDA